MEPTEDTGEDPRAGRLRVTGYAALQVLLLVPVILTFALTVVSSLLVFVWIGVLFLAGLIPLTRMLADAHRRMAATTLGAPVPAPYRPASGHLLARLAVRAGDPMSWRDLLWMVWAISWGPVLSLLTVILMIGVVTTPIWWFGAVHLMRARAWIDRALLTHGRTERLEQRVHDLAESRAVVVDHSAAELRRIERDLHDGPQARLAALSLSLGMADDLFETDPEAARRMVNDARTSSSTVLGELRDVVRGIHPPVLADRGLAGAVQALAIDMAQPVEVTIDLPRLPAPVESAVYFAVAECLANAGKHAAAERMWIRMSHAEGTLSAEVGDDGRGGADPRSGSGLRGVAARLAAFDGRMRVSSPPGGPTVVTWEVPCASSSPKTTRSSAPG